MFVSPQNSYAEILTSDLMASGDSNFGRFKSENGALMNETDALIRETPQSS